ncbi:MAG: molybdate ABC transporter substrate-binding protein, partial [Eubacteriales bacterium]|nr:molybdate ABC transporter substrate-binding protein [Eubacteriales bacterium]
MKKYLSIFIVLFIVIANILILTSCTETPSENETEITVFAASSMTETLTEIAQIYESENEDIKITYNFDSSGTLKTQIEEGAYCDLFISASATPMDNLSCVDNDSRIDLLENKVVLVAPNGNPKNISSFDDMVDKLVNNELLIAIGNFDVPVGEYTMRIFDYYNLSVEELDENSSITYGSNVKEVTTQVSEGLVD